LKFERAFQTLLIAILVFSSIALAQSVRAPASFELTPDSKEFTIKASNDSDTAQLVSISWSSPIGYNVEPVPTSLPAYSTQTFKINLSPTKEQSNQTIQTTLRVSVGSTEVEKKIELAIGDFSKKSASTTGFFVLPAIKNLGEIADWVLIAIIIILVLAVAVRLANRKRKQEVFQ